MIKTALGLRIGGVLCKKRQFRRRMRLRISKLTILAMEESHFGIKNLIFRTRVIILGGALAFAFGQLGEVLGEERPNIIFFIADDVSQDDFGCYGHPSIKTPNVDRLAAIGLRFYNAYLAISSCSPSRCSTITGRYPHNTGAPELHSGLPDDQIRFPELLKEAGYYTVLSGKNHMFGNKDRAFDKITKGGGPSSSEDWVDHVRDRPKDQPFFFWFAAVDAHRAWQIG